MAAEEEAGPLPTALEVRLGDIPAFSAAGGKDVIDSRLRYDSCLYFGLANGGDFTICDIACEYRCGFY